MSRRDGHSLSGYSQYSGSTPCALPGYSPSTPCALTGYSRSTYREPADGRVRVAQPVGYCEYHQGTVSTLRVL